ncbi:hypothetical protein [Microvirga sp. CF3016]|uniref:hypothetical protein n=1 Tax=Microvirga sp. CF3016 TaxID=3110181 RepID=UPI002E77043C|nr:hypothetical protein [Microvirga sp. CF3016]MEE1613680.1 hypothetical protein [Microvirga sp. CF3016]
MCFIAFWTIFFTWTFPANQATANWTISRTIGARCEAWEYSHAANAVVMLSRSAL